MKRTKGPKCECECGKSVNWNQYKKEWNQYLPGHNLRIPLSENQERKRREKISKSMMEYLRDNEEARKVRAVFIGKTHTKEARQKMSEKAKIREQAKRDRGHTRSQKTRAKISKAMKGRNITWKDKISTANTGKNRPEELRERLSNSLKEYYKNNINPFKNRNHTESSKLKMREANLYRFRGKNGPNWQGGISSFPYGIEWTNWLREEVKKRDGYRCKICGENKKSLDVHHIDFDKNNNNPNNLITLCKHHHGKANRGITLKQKLTELIEKYIV